MKKSLLLLLLSVFTQINCFSQLNVTNNSIATALAQTIAGNGVTVSNATINCNSAASGTFSYAGSNLGLTNGIILSTGQAVDAVSSGTSASLGTDFSTTYTDPNLTTIEPLATNDVCLVAFDFVPICNSLNITFVFASNEYPTFVSGSYNDAFGIFLTGSKPGGGNYSGYNIATLPNGTPVSIHNVNNVTPSNPQYYVDNYTTPNNQIGYNGYTIPITSVTSIVPCVSYHMEIAIADAGDGSYDSGVFIQGNSVSCTNTPTVTASAVGATCGTLGSASVTVTNYTGTPTYQWSPGGATTASITNLTPGTYTCLVGMQLGCGTSTQTVTATVTSSGANFNYNVTPQNPSCNNGTNGTANVSVTGGTAPYTYTWTTTPAQNTATATNLAAGTYTVNVQDNTGCIGSTTVTLTNPAAIVASVTTTSTSCAGAIGTAIANVTSGGVAPYTYAWSTTPVQTTQSINGLTTGTYSVIITDANTCTTTANGIVGGQGFTWTASASGTNPLCATTTDGSATVTINNGGANTFSYNWTTTPSQSNATATNLGAGTYTVFVTDNNGCISNSSVTLISPPIITPTVNTSPTICTGSTGSATVNVLSGGIAPYSYTWLTNPVQTSSVAINLTQGTYSVVVIDNNNCSTVTSGSVNSTGFTWTPVATSSPTKCFGSSDGTATVNINNSPAGNTYTYAWTPGGQTTNITSASLAAGNYTVTVKDNNGCVSTASTTVTQPAALTASGQANPTMCTSASGSTNAIISGGTTPYSFVWNPGGQTTQMATNLAQGQYTVLVTDANNCTTTTTALVRDTTDLTVIASQSPDLCSKGVGKATANPKGQAPYSYIWTTNPVQTTQTADSLQVGSYSVTVTDSYGCISATSVMVVNKDDILSAEFSTTPPGVINAEDPIALNMTTGAGWKVDSAYLSNGVAIDKNPFPYTFAQYGDYTATYYFVSTNGCKDTVTYNILVKDYITLYIPSAFTPNGDGRNDNFEAQGTFIKTFEMYIYDRWGVLVKKMTDINTTWDGTKNGGIAPEDIYVYKGSASDIFGKFVSFHGQISLIR